jgi:RND family efflux transporter MFP subunit
MRRVVLAGVSVCIAVATPGLAADELPCFIKPNVVVSIGSPVQGVIDQIMVQPGAVIEGGQVLATLESSLEHAEVALAKTKAEVQAPLRNAEVRMEFTGRKAKRSRELRQRGAIAEHEADEAEGEARLAEVARAEALENRQVAEMELKRAQAALALRTIRSPVAGVVVERYMAVGELVRQSPILKVVQLNPLRVEMHAPTSWLGRIRGGMPVQLLLDGAPEKSYEARVERVSPLVEAASGTFGVYVELPNPDARIPAGIPCKARFAK